jgi:hypothetical protein
MIRILILSNAPYPHKNFFVLVRMQDSDLLTVIRHLKFLPHAFACHKGKGLI